MGDVTMDHVCDDRCVCPVHQTPLFYAPSVDDHACQDVTCVHGHGGLTGRSVRDIPDSAALRERAIEAAGAMSFEQACVNMAAFARRLRAEYTRSVTTRPPNRCYLPSDQHRT